MKYRDLVLYVFFFITSAYSTSLNACSFFCAARNGEVLVAGNEDFNDPFSKMWIRSKSKDNYGCLLLGHSDYQAQIGINEYGLSFDFAAIPEAEGKNNHNKNFFDGDLFTEILAKCKNVDEAIKYFEKYKFHTPTSQALISDAQGNSILINQDAIIKRTSDYQISTNFNSCNIETGNYDCKRYKIIDEVLSKKTDISIALFRRLLSSVHQEGKYPTQFSYVFDLKRGDIYLYSFHNYENVIKLNVKKELAKGFALINLKELFPVSFEEDYFREHHKDSLKQSILSIIKNKNATEGIKTYETYTKKNPKVASYPFLLWDLGADLVKETWVIESKGKPFNYWWYPDEYFSWKSNHPNIDKALKIFTYLENIPKDDPKQQIGAFEMKGFIYNIKNEITKAKNYFDKTIQVSPENIGNYKRSKQFLNYLKINGR